MLCGPTGAAGAACAALLGRAAWCARGRRPARSPSAPRASLGASSRSPARPRHRPRAPLPGAVGQVDRWFETVIAFACWYLCGIETAIAFAGKKKLFLAQFSGAEVMGVSMVAVQGSAVVLSVSKSPCCRAMCAKKFALLGLMWA